MRMLKSKKAQTAMEVITIFGVILIAVTGVVNYMGSAQTRSIRAEQARESIETLQRAAGEIYDAGGGTKTVRIYMPTAVNHTLVTNQTMLIRVQVKDGYADAVGILDRDVTLVGHIPMKSGENMVKVMGITDKLIKIGEGHGVVICGQNYYCGTGDGVCPADYGVPCTSVEDEDC